MAQRSSLTGILALLGLALVLWGGIAGAEEGKQVMLVFTTETDGEINPCG